MNYYGSISLLNGIFALFIGGYAFLQKKRNSLHYSFSLFCFAIAFWAIFYAVWQMQTEHGAALWLIRIAMAFCSFVPATFLWFALNVVESPRKEKFKPWCLCLSGVFSALFATPLMIRDVEQRLFFEYWPVPGPLLYIYFLIFNAAVFYGLLLLYQSWQNSSGARRWQAKWIFFTTLFIWAGGLTNWFLWFNILIPPFPNFSVALFLLILGYGIVRRQLFDVDILADVIQEAKLSALGMLSASINHEIINPLYVASTAIESLECDQKEGLLKGLSREEYEKRVFESLEKVKKQLTRATAISRRFSDYIKQKKTESVPESIKITDLIKDVLLFAEYELAAKKVRVMDEINPDHTIYGDRRQLEEVFLNLIMNSCQAMYEDGGFIQLKSIEEKGKIKILVIDNGKGIPKDKINKIFEPFVTTKGDKGMGLGLYVVRRMLEENKGKISVASDYASKTTRFCVEMKS